MTLIDLIGAIAGTLTTLAFIPQVIKTWRSGSAEDISLVMFLLFTTGVVLWLIYGIALNALPIIIANSITLLLALTILILKIRYMVSQRRRLSEADNRPL
jgi:MtN3 and saliva related transmembrane protein